MKNERILPSLSILDIMLMYLLPSFSSIQKLYCYSELIEKGELNTTLDNLIICCVLTRCCNRFRYGCTITIPTNYICQSLMECMKIWENLVI